MSTIQEQREQQLRDLAERSIYYRGHILHRTAILEKEMEVLIVMYFRIHQDNQLAFMELILDRMSFSDKISVMEQILKKVFTDLFEKECSKTMILVRYIKDVRNSFAHYNVFLSYKEDEKIPKEFSLTNYRNEVKHTPFTKGDFSLFNDRFEKTKKNIIQWRNILAAI
ncbi:hypothetical protein [Pedobacter sp.]|uniref:hypothetical protein n=1 Tax=Pedobacter sp. TaxID=1411316 RepID=UPI00396C36B4